MTPVGLSRAPDRPGIDFPGKLPQMPNVEHEILRSLFRCLAPDGKVDIGLFFEDHVTLVARYHRLSSLLGSLRTDGVPARLAERFRQDHISALGRNTFLRHALCDCIRLLQGHGIEAIVLKGLAYEERLYTRPGSRPTSDVDLLVPARHRRAAFEALHAAGWTPVAAAPGFDEPDYHEVEWTRNDVYLDLHFALAPLPRCGIDYDELWAGKLPMRLDEVDAFRLADTHAAVYHVLHMAIHHFDVPGLYLVDLARMVTNDAEFAAVGVLAQRWRCLRPWQTSVILTAYFLPWWPLAAAANRFAGDAVSGRIVEGFGTVTGLPRASQLRRKLEHFDVASDAARYLFQQGRRIVREAAMRRLTSRSPEERLGFRKP